MEYQLASSSAEEGEIVERDVPYHKSYLQYYYYPDSTWYIGKNTVPHFNNYKSDKFCLKLKKDLKADYSYIQFGLLENSKTFFDNKFILVKDLRPSSPPMGWIKADEFNLVDIKSDYKEIANFEKKPQYEGKYDKFFQQLFFHKGEKSPLTRSISSRFKNKVFVFEDRVLAEMRRENAYIFFRVAFEKSKITEINSGDGQYLGIEGSILKDEVTECNSDSKVLKKYIFEDIFYSKASFYEYLDLYAETFIKSFNSEEIRIYEARDILAIVYSGTTFRKDGTIKRIFNNVDVERNSRIICNMDGPSIISLQGRIDSSIELIVNLDLGEGDYVINGGNVLKISPEGSSVECSDIYFDDFTKTRWE